MVKIAGAEAPGGEVEEIKLGDFKARYFFDFFTQTPHDLRLSEVAETVGSQAAGWDQLNAIVSAFVADPTNPQLQELKSGLRFYFFGATTDAGSSYMTLRFDGVYLRQEAMPQTAHWTMSGQNGFSFNYSLAVLR